jgi:hypothetical protein
MQMPRQIRRIPVLDQLLLCSRGNARDFGSLELPLEDSLGMRREGQQPTRGPDVPAVSARRVLPAAQAVSLLQSNEAAGLRALAHLFASFHCNSPMPRPSTRCERSRVSRWPGKEQDAGKDGTWPASARPTSFRRCPPRVPRLTPRLFARFAHSQTKPGGQARSARAEAPRQSRLGALLLLSLAGASSCFCPDRLSQRWGASFAFRRLGASHHAASALGGLRELSLKDAKVLASVAPVARASSAPVACGRAASARPTTPACNSKLGFFALQKVFFRKTKCRQFKRKER